MVKNLVNAYGVRVLAHSDSDMQIAYNIIDNTIRWIDYHLMTTKYSNQATYRTILLLKYEVKILKNRFEQNTGVISN